MPTALDPSIPEHKALLGLTQVEEMLISRVLPVESVFRLPFGQLGYRGHVLYFPTTHGHWATKLPRHPKDLPLAIVRFPGCADRPDKDCIVRRNRVLHALHLLKDFFHHPLYQDVEIDAQAAYLPAEGVPADLPSAAFSVDDRDRLCLPPKTFAAWLEAQGPKARGFLTRDFPGLSLIHI